jgi:hypothetical protein
MLRFPAFWWVHFETWQALALDRVVVVLGDEQAVLDPGPDDLTGLVFALGRRVLEHDLPSGAFLGVRAVGVSATVA